MIAALAQSQLPDFSFRSDLLRSKSIAKFIGKLDGGGRLQREDLVNQWMHLGFIVEDSSSGDTRYVEDERDFKV